MTLGERIRDHLVEHGAISASEASKLFGVSRNSAAKTLRFEATCGVLAVIPGPAGGPAPRYYRLAYQACPVFGLVGVT